MTILDHNEPASPGQRALLILLGVVLALGLLECGMRGAGAAYQGYQRATAGGGGDDDRVRILCIGESTTALGGPDAYPRRLEQALNAASRTSRFSVINRGVPGTTTGHMVTHLSRYLDQHRPQLVVAMVGINDRDGGNFRALDPNADRPAGWRSLRVVKLLTAIGRGLGKRLGTDPLYDVKNPKDYMDFWVNDFRNPCNGEPDLARLRRAVESNPGDAWALMVLSRCEEVFGEAARTEPLLRRAAAADPKNPWIYGDLGKLYFKKGELDQAEPLLLKAIRLNPRSNMAHNTLKQLYYRRNRPDKAREFFEETVRRDPTDDAALRRLAIFFREQGKTDLARLHLSRAERLTSKAHSATTEYNYLKLYSILQKRGIPLVAVQYPMRRLKPLRRLFAGKAGVTLVENRRPFERVLHDLPLDAYFEDMFAGDFGHCNRAGNRALAQNIAAAIQRMGRWSF